MTLASRLVFAFGLIALMSTALIGVIVREEWRRSESASFQAQVQGAVQGVRQDLAWQKADVRDLLRPLCEHDSFVDRTLVDLEANRLDGGRRLAIAQLVPDEMKALRLDELVLLTSSGDVLGVGNDPALVGTTDRALAGQLSAPDSSFPSVRPPSVSHAGKPRGAALMARCIRKSGSFGVGLVGGRNLAPLLERLASAYGVRMAVAGEPGSAARPGEIVEKIDLGPPAGLQLVIAKSRAPLDQALSWLDQVVIATGAASLAISAILAFILARSIARPISLLASEVREVVAGEPHEVPVRGSKEVRQLASAFNKTLRDLSALRRRQAATERIAAWREVARRVAHEIKNPLTPIRSAMETLRRLRARGDPKFDEYFDQATAGVLDDVHRIASIASDFARFARLPPPKPAAMNPIEVAKSVVAMHAETGIDISVSSTPCPSIQADRDQIVQMLTNLIQNAMDAVRGAPHPRVEVVVEPNGGDQVRIAVHDNGPGVPSDAVVHLFEPYYTTKSHGTGLGLSIVQRIVVEHAGEISYARSPLGGACFSAVLPCCGPPPASSPRSDVAEAVEPQTP